MEVKTEKTLVLVLGGSSFMGKDLLQKLSTHSNLEVHYINRGKTYWNNEVKQIPNLHHTFGDRDDPEKFTQILKDLNTSLGITAESGKKWGLVVDFCAYEKKHTQSVYNGLCGLASLYVFISTDSLYDVCDREIRDLPRIVETFAVRPKDPELQKKYKKKESYGHKKLKCEETLNQIPEKQQFPFINFRLPDVLGPYDDSGRFWACIEWIKKSKESPFEIEKEFETKELSFVFSEDVTDLIIRISGILPGTQIDPKTLFLSYNLACEEALTLKDFLGKIAKELELPITTEIVDETETVFPSVVCGALDCRKAISLLDWKPTSLDKVIEKTTKFFEQTDAKTKYHEEYEGALKNLPKKLRNTNQKSNKESSETSESPESSQ